MNAANKWTLSVGALVFLLIVLFPPWQQVYQGHSLVYSIQMGHHFLWNPPAAVGFQDLIAHALPAECQVKVAIWILVVQCVSVFAVTLALFLFLRVPKQRMSLATSLTTHRLLVVSLLFAVCLPVPFDKSMPLLAMLITTPVFLLRNNTHMEWWLLPMQSVSLLAIYFTGCFLATSGLAWLVKHRARPFRLSV
jgi:hypothetical protein